MKKPVNNRHPVQICCNVDDDYKGGSIPVIISLDVGSYQTCQLMTESEIDYEIDELIDTLEMARVKAKKTLLEEKKKMMNRCKDRLAT